VKRNYLDLQQRTRRPAPLTTRLAVCPRPALAVVVKGAQLWLLLRALPRALLLLLPGPLFSLFPETHLLLLPFEKALLLLFLLTPKLLRLLLMLLPIRIPLAVLNLRQLLIPRTLRRLRALRMTLRRKLRLSLLAWSTPRLLLPLLPLLPLSLMALPIRTLPLTSSEVAFLLADFSVLAGSVSC